MKDQFSIVILAAGLGTRLKSRRAKVLHSVGGKTLIEHAVQTARALSPKNIFVIVGHQGEEVMEVLSRPSAIRAGDSQAPVSFIRQQKQLGTGHALLCGRQELEPQGRLVVFCGDTPLIRAETLQGLLAFHARSGAAATVMTAEVDDPAGYGRIVRGPKGELREIVEHKVASPDQLAIREINSGSYCFETKSLFGPLAALTPQPRSGEYYLTDVIASLGRKKVAAYKVADAAEVTGINNRVELAEVDAVLRGRKARELMLAGVTIFRPETVQIDSDVMVGVDTVIEPGVALAGPTRVGENCRIGAFSIITNSEIGDNVTVNRYCAIEGSRIMSGASVGPFSRVRPGSEIGPDTRIGNFVEVKKSIIGRGSKAQHLTYIGDATIGENVNVGAGTITCNYDGEKKHPTVIEDNVFIGSGTELVAPVRVGRNAYVGAGSTITEEVPPDSLGIARGRQVNKPGWVTERKKKAKKKK